MVFILYNNIIISDDFVVMMFLYLAMVVLDELWFFFKDVFKSLLFILDF